MPREEKDQSRTADIRQQNRASETDHAEPGDREAGTAKDINVVRGDDQPQTVRPPA